MSSKPQCLSCPFFEPPKEPQPDVDPAHDIFGVYRDGLCVRFPQAVKKRPAQTCGEHPSWPRKKD